MAKELVFYTNPMSRGRIVRWMLEEVGAPYRTQIVQYGPEMKSADYLAINPMGKVPAIRHGEVVVTECAAICAYLADAFPEAGLAPPATARGAYYRWLFFAAGPFEAATTDRMLKALPSAEQEAMVGYGKAQNVVDTLAHALTNTDYVAGERFSAADVYVGSHVQWGMDMTGMLEKRPVFVDYWARLRGREAYLRAGDLDDAIMGN
ncbi:MAG: glutathione S-transferase family protein [Gammaproteobacteria bacterium]|nr:glutathione S-transferase family protein [Gammaproteobacteria bacterium]